MILDAGADLLALNHGGDTVPAPISAGDVLLHGKYKIPARCFAYVGDASDPATWKLPCRLLNGAIDEGRLSGAIHAIFTNYCDIPESAVVDVLVQLGKAAAEAGKMPGQTGAPAHIYRALYDTLHQLGRLQEVLQ